MVGASRKTEGNRKSNRTMGHKDAVQPGEDIMIVFHYRREQCGEAGAGEEKTQGQREFISIRS